MDPNHTSGLVMDSYNPTTALAPESTPDVPTDSVQTMEDSAGKPKLLLMGMRRSGKSSIANVVFHKLAPSETIFLETTTRLRQESMYSFMEFQVWDFPGHIQYFGEQPSFDINTIFDGTGALIWVIDAQDEYADTIWPLINTILHLKDNELDISVHVFIHKVDGLSDIHRTKVFQDIVQKVQDELNDNGYNDFSSIGFHPTSIYDHSVFEAFSHVIRRLIPELPMVETLLDSLCARSGIQKAYVFDVLTKIAVASDTSPSDSENYETCSDYIDLVVDISELYGWDRFGVLAAQPTQTDGINSVPPNHKPSGTFAGMSPFSALGPLTGVIGTVSTSTASGSDNNQLKNTSSTTPSHLLPHNPAALSKLVDPLTGNSIPLPGELPYAEIGNSDTESLVTRPDGRSMFLYLREMNQFLVLVCILNERMPLDRKALCAHNIKLFQQTLNTIFQASSEAAEVRRRLYLRKHRTMMLNRSQDNYQ